MQPPLQCGAAVLLFAALLLLNQAVVVLFLIQATNRGLNTLHQILSFFFFSSGLDEHFFKEYRFEGGLHQLEIKLYSSVRIRKENYCVQKVVYRYIRKAVSHVETCNLIAANVSQKSNEILCEIHF